MTGDHSALRVEIKQLQDDGFLLGLAMADEFGQLSDGDRENLKKKKLELPSFKTKYQAWYSVALQVIRQVLPDRVEDFRSQYRNDKRKEVDFLTYTISDYLIGLQTTWRGQVKTDGSAAVPKFLQQVAILDAAAAALDSKLMDLQDVLQADLFDSELDAAEGLASRGFFRAAGAIAGVVLEKHLGHVCEVHSLKTRKKSPTINDFNQMLKDASAIDTAKWRFIQHLGDLRNLCDHPKEREPTKDDAIELVEGVRKVARTVT